MKIMNFVPGHATNRFKLLALRPVDIIHQCIVNTGSDDLAIVALEFWRLLSKIVLDVEPGELTIDDDNLLNDIAFDVFSILTTNDVKLALGRVEQIKCFTAINLTDTTKEERDYNDHDANARRAV
jgi:hypothetical protein